MNLVRSDKMYFPQESYAQNIFQPYGTASFFYKSEDFEKLQSLASNYFVVFTSSLVQIIDPQGIFLFDLVISQITESHAEFQKTQPFIGELFSQTFYGSTPMVISVSGYLLETAANNAKQAFLRAYTEFLRIGSVARNKIAPVLQYNDIFLEGAMLDLNIGETGQNSELIKVDFSYMVFTYFQTTMNTEGASKGAFGNVAIDYFYPGNTTTSTNPPPASNPELD